jgi:murein tripeptide amidase MpaA
MSTWSTASYLNYEQLTAHLEELADEYPDILRLDTLGRSHEGREIWLVIMTRFASGEPGHKPALWLDANIHSAELVSSMAALNFIDWLLQNQEAEDIQRCLDSRTLYICPRVNPDGAEWALAPAPRIVRSSVRPYPFDEPLWDGLDVQDIDGDGRILTMRIPDPHGPWKISDQDERLLVRRDPAESGGEYFRLLPEGLIRNYDGFHLPAASKAENLDLNRNFPVQWRGEHEQKGAGCYPASEPEVRALVDFITGHANICAGLSLHSYSGVLLRPYSFKPDDDMPAEDLWLYQAIGRQGEKLTGYPAVSAYHDFRYHPQEVITGAMDDWLYDAHGQLAWTVELWSPHRQAGIEAYDYIDWYREHPLEDDLKLLQWNDSELQGQACVDWYPYEHPQLGEVMLGGWNVLFSFWNPPPDKLAQEVARLPEWLLWHTLITPRLEWLHCDVIRMDDDVYQVDAAVVNSGWLPTQVSQHALKQNLLRGVLFELELPDDARLLQGKLQVDAGQLKGRSDKPCTPHGWLGQSLDPSDDRARAQWLIEAEAGTEVVITVRHERAGRLQQKLRLID